MKKLKIIWILIILILITTLAGCTNQENKEEFKIVTSFYPIYIIALNLTEGAENVSLENMSDIQTGCLHDYTLKTADLKKIENADVFIINGLGIEENIISKLYNSESSIIDASQNIEQEIIQEEEAQNGHVWMSIDLYIYQIEEIANSLVALNPDNEQIYNKNKQEYIQKLNELKTSYEEIKRETSKLNVILFSESLEYFLEDFNIKTTSVHMHHEENTASSKELAEITDMMKENNIKIIIIDNLDNKETSKTIANETNAKVYELDSCLYGELEKDSYINKIKENINTLKEITNEN